MKDHYPQLDSLPQEWLVPPEDQPEYADIPGFEIDESTGLGNALSDAHVAAGHGGDIAIIHHESGRQLTYAELADRSGRLAAALHAQGLREGDRVALRGPNVPELLIAAIAVWKLGAIVALIPVLARPADIDFYLRDTQPAACILTGREGIAEIETIEAQSPRIMIALEESGRAGWQSWDTLIECNDAPPEVPVNLDRVAVVWHTGGTTGRPKGCYHTQRRYLLAGEAIRRASGGGRGQRWSAAAPIGHAFGFISSTNFTLQHGATLVLVENFAQPDTLLKAIAHHGITHFAAIAVTWARMLALLDDGKAPKPTTLRTCFAMWQSSSASHVTAGWQRHGVELLNNFGSTAFATWVLVPPLGQKTPPGTLGVPSPGYEVRLLDPDDGPDVTGDGIPGRMAVRGPSGLTYWRLPDKQRQDVKDGWTLHDDLLCRQGPYLNYLGRTDFLISTAGNKVAPSEVEAVLSTHPAVQEVLVMGLPDPLRQEMVTAFVAVTPGFDATPALARELQDLVKSRLSPYKYPRHVEFVDALPRDDVGKVKPRELRDRALKSSSAITARNS